jgi:hypothetical protein
MFWRVQGGGEGKMPEGDPEDQFIEHGISDIKIHGVAVARAERALRSGLLQ